MKATQWRNLALAIQSGCVLFAAGRASAASYTNDTNWGGANWTLANGDVISGVHTNVGVFSIPGGVTVTVQAYNTNTLSHGRVRIFAASADIQGTLSANGKGYPAATGTGKGGGHAGGGYGGLGGQSDFGLRGSMYGSSGTPDELGSGGGNYKNAGGAGGGSMILNVAGTLAVAGTLSANGGDASGQNGGGSGGSIWLAAGTLEGMGSLTADGGTSSYGGGGGGRIALDVGANYFTGTIRAKGQSSNISRGRNGTLNFESDPDRHLVVSNDIALPPGANWEFASLLVTNGATLDIQSIRGESALGYADEVASRVRVAGDLTVAQNAMISADGLGYPEAKGPGAGPSYSGGGYGGKGGAGAGGSGGDPYGSSDVPNRLGSGGGNAKDNGGFGAGAVILDVAGTLRVYGSISACGGGGVKQGGAGSGGSIWLTARSIAGNGAILAEGGVPNLANSTNGGGGGGGRILLDYGGGSSVAASWEDPELASDLDFDGTLSAAGGIGSTVLRSGADGSVLLRHLPPAGGTVISIR